MMMSYIYAYYICAVCANLYIYWGRELVDEGLSLHSTLAMDPSERLRFGNETKKYTKIIAKRRF